MKDLKIGDSMFHPCSIDIIEHKIISIREFETHKHYYLKAVNNVGACGRVEVIVDEHKGNFRFVDLVNEENIPYASGLQDFIEGKYYTSLNQARLEFYEQQATIAWSNKENKERLYKESLARYEQVQLLVKNLKEDLK